MRDAGFDGCRSDRNMVRFLRRGAPIASPSLARSPARTSGQEETTHNHRHKGKGDWNLAHCQSTFFFNVGGKIWVEAALSVSAAMRTTRSSPCH